MHLPTIQPLSPEKQKLALILGGVIGIVGLIAILAGALFNPQPTIDDQTEKTSTSEKKPSGILGGDNPSVSKKPTPAPTINETYVRIVNQITPSPTNTPTPTPLRGTFYTPNGQQNDLTIKLLRKNEWDIFVELQLINTKTKEIRAMGKAFEASPGDSAFFSKNFSTVIFIGGHVNEDDYEKISFYSIPQNKIIKQISLGDIKKAIPSLPITASAVLSRLTPSPNGQKAAVSYGSTYNPSIIDPNTAILILDLNTNRISLAPVKGLVQSWKDDTTLIYEPTPGSAQEVKI